MSTRLAGAFIENVRARMEDMGLNQKALAKKLRVKDSYISQILSGHRRPGLDSLESFSKALECEPADLLKILENAR